MLTPRLRKRKADLGRAFVTIVAPGRRTPVARIRPECTEPVQPARSFAAGSFLGGEEGEGPVSGSTASPASAARPVIAPAPVPPITDDDVRGEESPLFAGLPSPFVLEDAEGLPLFLGLAVLALLAVSLVGVLVEVVRHLRSPRF